jgi:hypothetical protein
VHEACFPLGKIVRVNSKTVFSLTNHIAKICFFALREQIRLVGNGLNTRNKKITNKGNSLMPRSIQSFQTFSSSKST